MLGNKKLYGIIPVRGGSKGIPKKNLIRLGGLTLLERAITLGQSCKYVDRVLVSTDDPEMFVISKRYNAAIPALRPSYLATDTAKTVDVVLDVVEKAKIKNSYILLLQVTSPLRTLEDLYSFIKRFEDNLHICDAIVSLTEFDNPHPNKIQKKKNGFVKSYIGVESMVPRQELPKVYKLNGAFYMTSTEILKKYHTFIPERTLPFIMPEERSLNLDTIYDLYLLEALIQRGIVKLK
ncbi:MAG: acylneuraminate cytidylyltransferase family protein [Actinobacteria bacterium]|nr:acylneuraminate cytidylyltransferase family protein [Actinomycetota bacterium]